MSMLSVEEALRKVLDWAANPVAVEHVPIAEAFGRTLATPLAALRTQPPFAASAMDGYAVRGEDVAAPGAVLRVIGTAPAGHAFPGRVGQGEAVRIFTGAPLPEGADTILIQENAEKTADGIVAQTAEPKGRFVRPAGLDFQTGQALLEAGRRIDPRAHALAAAMGHATLAVRRRPRVAILATGDELVRPGESARADQIVASNGYAVAGIVAAEGGEPLDLGIATDDFGALERAIEAAEAAKADVLVTLGGASVGDHDLVQSALTARGMQLGFWRIAMRPGKPLIFGSLGRMAILGLPGNPVSSIVCATLFLVPLLRALSGDPGAGADRGEAAILTVDLPANDMRQDYLRSTLGRDEEGRLTAAPFTRQDSSMLRVLAEAEGLVIRPPHAPAAPAGTVCKVLRF